jgi:hypothetical protein
MGLEQWYMRNTYQFCQTAMQKGKIIGTQTHEAIERFITTGEMKVETEWPDEVTFALKSFAAFKKDHLALDLKLTETALTSLKYGFNGTIDAPRPPILYDWKTCEKKDKEELTIWPDWKYQASAYVYLWNENNPDQFIDSVCIVAIAKDAVAYRVETMTAQEISFCFGEVFLPALKIYNYQHKKEK